MLQPRIWQKDLDHLVPMYTLRGSVNIMMEENVMEKMWRNLAVAVIGDQYIVSSCHNQKQSLCGK